MEWQRFSAGFRPLFALGLFAAGACAPATVRPPASPGEARLPPVPEVRGELAIDMVYPGEGATVTSRDSTFVFGQVGRGDAALAINGAPVEVAPNGAWLAFLPVPPDGVYNLSATAAGRTVTAIRTVRVPAVPQPSGTALQIVPGSVTPAGVITGVRGEWVEVRFRGTPGADARLRLPDGTVVPLAERGAVTRSSGFMVDRAEADAGIAEYVGGFELTALIAAQDTAVAAPTLAGQGYLEERERQRPAPAQLELARGAEVVRVPLPAAIGVLEPMRPRLAVGATTRPDSTIVGRRQLGADQLWDFFWPNGTLLTVDGERQGFYRVRLGRDLTAWVAREDVQLLPEGASPSLGFIGPSVQLTPHPDRVDIRFSMSDRLPFRVVPGDRELAVEFYGVTGRPMYFGYGEEDDFVRRADWQQPSDDLFRFALDLSRPLWGFRYHWEGQALVVQVRRPPPIDPASPLRGLRIGIDAGHLGGAGDTGAIGPTRLTEVEVNLAVTTSLGPMLRAAGAEVVDIRPDDSTIVPLIERPLIATREDVHLFVSVHFNAFPDGVNPFENHGTIMFYYWPHSLGLARHLQREVLREIGLPDRGVRFQNLAIPRTTWMPSVLTETLFMMFPEQEAALRDPAFIERIARAHLRGIEGFLREAAGVDAR